MLDPRNSGAPAAELFPIRRQINVPPDPGPRPWCRVCDRLAFWWVWDRYADGTLGFCVKCHGDMMGGLLPPGAMFGRYRLEVFCEDEPRMRLMPIWWVTPEGNELQLSKTELDSAVAQGGLYGSPFGKWCRKNAEWVGGLAMTLYMSAIASGKIGWAFRISLVGYIALWLWSMFVPEKLPETKE